MLNFVVIDFESTGSIPGYPVEPWQLGMVRFRNGKLIPDEHFESLLKVNSRPFNKFAPGMHHSLRDELQQAPTLQELWPDLRPWWYDFPLVAHNIGVEKKFILQTAPLHKAGPWIDTLKLARIAWPGLNSHKLEDLIATLNLSDRIEKICPNRLFHDALYDAMACGVLLEYLLSQKGWENIDTPMLAKASPKQFYRLRNLTS